MNTLDLRGAGERAIALPRGELAPDDLQHAIVEWRGRMVSEHVSARVFAGLIGQMMRAGIGARRQTDVPEMVGQELRHARLCASIVEALGAEPVATLPDHLPDIPVHDDAGPLEALLRNLIAIACLEETVAVATLEAIRGRTRPAALGEVVREILADEVGHARLGWTLLEELHPLDGALRDRLGAYLVPAFRQLFARFCRPAPAPSCGASSYGTCDGPQDREVFLRTVSDVIVPGLEAFGIPAARAADAIAAESYRQARARAASSHTDLIGNACTHG